MAPMPSAYACSSSPRPAASVSKRPTRSRVFSGLRGATALVLVVVLSGLGCAHARGGREPPASVLEISTATSDADVWVDGQYIGQVAQVSGRLRLAPGIHRVEVRKPGHFPVQRTVRVEKQGGGTVVVEAELLTDPR
jgi:hypothetical protein